MGTSGYLTALVAGTTLADCRMKTDVSCRRMFCYWQHWRSCLLAVFLSSSIASATPATLVTFDGSGLVEGASVTTQFAGVTFSNAILALPGSPIYAFGVAPSQDDTILANTSFNGPFITDPLVGGDFAPSSTIRITFDMPANNVSFWVADIDGGPEKLTAAAFDSVGTQLGTVTVNAGDPGTGNGIATLISLPWNNIKDIDVLNVDPNTGIGGWGIDSLRFDPVPEPASMYLWAMAVGLASVWRGRTKSR